MTEQLIADRNTEDAMNTARILYAVHAVTFFFSWGLLSIIPLIINYAKRDEAQGTIVYSHHNWMIRSFWWFLALNALGWLLVATFIGILVAWVVFGGAWLWMAYRIIRGFIDLNNRRAMPG